MEMPRALIDIAAFREREAQGLITRDLTQQLRF